MTRMLFALVPASFLAATPALAHPGHADGQPLVHALWHLFDRIEQVVAGGALGMLVGYGIVLAFQRLAHARRRG